MSFCLLLISQNDRSDCQLQYKLNTGRSVKISVKLDLNWSRLQVGSENPDSWKEKSAILLEPTYLQSFVHCATNVGFINVPIVKCWNDFFKREGFMQSIVIHPEYFSRHRKFAVSIHDLSSGNDVETMKRSRACDLLQHQIGIAPCTLKLWDCPERALLLFMHVQKAVGRLVSSSSSHLRNSKGCLGAQVCTAPLFCQLTSIRPLPALHLSLGLPIALWNNLVTSSLFISSSLPPSLSVVGAFFFNELFFFAVLCWLERQAVRTPFVSIIRGR